MRIEHSLILSLATVLTVACGDDSSPSNTTTSGSDTTATPTTETPTTNTPPPATTENPGTTEATTTVPGTDSGTTSADTTAGESDSGTTSGSSSGTTEGEESSGSSGGEMGVNGCTAETAVDMTRQQEVTITDVAAWSIPHQVCITVSPGTDVTFEGNFTFHPLVGGATPTVDAGSPITMLGADSGKSALFTVPAGPGEYPYFCDVHLGTMQGVIYVQ